MDGRIAFRIFQACDLLDFDDLLTVVVDQLGVLLCHSLHPAAQHLSFIRGQVKIDELVQLQLSRYFQVFSADFFLLHCLSADKKLFFGSISLDQRELFNLGRTVT